jgi:hypothetical protein
MTAHQNLSRELTAEEMLAVSGGRLGREWVAINQFVHPMDIVTAIDVVKEIEIVAFGR